jgi:hypothetical protein
MVTLRSGDSTGTLTARQDGGDFVFGPIVIKSNCVDASEVPEGVAHLIIESSDSRIQRLEIPIQYYSDQGYRSEQAEAYRSYPQVLGHMIPRHTNRQGKLLP